MHQVTTFKATVTNIFSSDQIRIWVSHRQNGRILERNFALLLELNDLRWWWSLGHPNSSSMNDWTPVVGQPH
jgi:hypothetical protein